MEAGSRIWLLVFKGFTAALELMFLCIVHKTRKRTDIVLEQKKELV